MNTVIAKTGKVLQQPPTPILIGADRTEHFERTFDTFINTTSITRIVDDYENQLRELFYIRNASIPEDTPAGKAKEAQFIKKHLGAYPDLSYCGTWVYYPWTNTLVHVLSQSLHQEIRTARNRNLVSAIEQDRFASCVVGIAGLSIGNSVALTLAYSGGTHTMKLADPDVFSASNLNRVRVPLHYLGAKKVYVAAQQIYEINPYANLILYPDGITGKTIENFLVGSPKLQIVADEMDDIKLKIFLRLAARAARIPLVMATDNGDNAIVDVERYDLDPFSKPFDTLPQLRLSDIARGISFGEPLALTIKEKVKLATKLVGAQNAAPRMQESLLHVGGDLKSWPQLGIAAFLGGAALAYVIKKIALGNVVKSGKTHISLDTLFETTTPPSLTDRLTAHINDPRFIPYENYAIWDTKDKDFPKKARQKEQLKFILNFAIMAPSSHNTQPWRFEVSDTCIILKGDPSRALPVSDSTKREFYISLGACLFNLRVALAYFGFDAVVTYAVGNQSNRVAVIDCVKTNKSDVVLSSKFIGLMNRFTDKQKFLPKPIPSSFRAYIAGCSGDTNIDITLVYEKKSRKKIAEFIASATVQIMKQSPFRQELSRWLRHNYTRQFDGMPASTMGIGDIQSIIGPFLMNTVNLATGESDRACVWSSPLLVIVTAKKESPVAWVKLGEIYEHILLYAATKHIHSATLTALVESSIASRKARQLLVLPGIPQAFIRLGYSNSPVTRSPRLPVELVLD